MKNTKYEKVKKDLRLKIIKAAKEYKSNLMSNNFLYVYNGKYFEVAFYKENFAHLTGVNSNLGAKQFFDKSCTSTITTQQFYFDTEHPLRNAKKKLEKLEQLSNLTKECICVVTDLTTNNKVQYKLIITNLEITLRLMNDVDKNGNLKSNMNIPRSFTVKDKVIENSKDGDIVDFIFKKKQKDKIYSEILYQDKTKEIPLILKGIIDNKFYKNINYKSDFYDIDQEEDDYER